MLHLTNPVPDVFAVPRFAIRHLSVLQYANGFTLWHVKAPAIADVMWPNYFAEACDMLASGDHMHVSAPDGAALLHVVSSNHGEVVVRRMMG